MLRPIIDEQLTIRLATGAVSRFTFRDLFGFICTLPFFLVISFGFVVVATGHPATMPQFSETSVRLAFWLFAVIIYVPSIFLFGAPVRILWRRFSNQPLPHLLFSIPVICLVTAIAAEVFIEVFEPDKNLSEVVMWQMMVRGIVIGLTIETIILAWLLPNYRKSKEPQQRFVTLAGQRFLLDDILRVQAAEHHLELYRPEGITTIRERMSTFIEQVAPEDGVQTHRSHWVSRRAAVRMTGCSLVLPCGKDVPVARARKEEVAAWCDAFAPRTPASGEPTLPPTMLKPVIQAEPVVSPEA